MGRNAIIKTDGSLDYDKIGGFDDQIGNLSNVVFNAKYPPAPLVGIKIDGVTDDTQALNNLINFVSTNGGGKITIPSGTCMIKGWDDNYKSADANHNANYNYQGGIILKNNVWIDGVGRGATSFQEITTNSDNYNVFRIKDVDHVKLTNLTILGDLSTHTGTTGEYGHGVMILNSQNVFVDIEVKNTWGDGIYIGIAYNNSNTSQTQNVVIYNPVIDKASRNGISMCSGKNILISNPIITNVTRMFPKAGIDIEPEGTGGTITPILDNVIIENIKTEGNSYGISINMNSKVGYTPVSVKFKGFVSSNDVVGLSATSLDEIAVKGSIDFDNVKVNTAGWTGVSIGSYLNIHPKLNFKNVRIYNCNNTNQNTNDNTQGWTDGGAFVISRTTANSSTVPIGNVTCENLEVIDDRGTQLINVAFLCYDANGLSPLNVTLINPIRLDALRIRQRTNVRLTDSNNVFTSDIAYYQDAWNADYPQTIIKTSGTTQRRMLAISNNVADGNMVTLINDSANGLTIDLDNVSPRLMIYPFSNTNRYLVTTQQGATMQILRSGGKFYAINSSGTWTNSTTS